MICDFECKQHLSFFITKAIKYVRNVAVAITILIIIDRLFIPCAMWFIKDTKTTIESSSINDQTNNVLRMI